MDFLKPIFTESAQCQDCYKCLRQCSAKAIEIQEGHAKVMHDFCIMCGHCVQTCPVGAKKVRNDLERARLLIKSGKKVIVSLAPSFVTEFADVSIESLTAAIRKLGFYGVSETALGAQEVSANVASHMKQTKGGIYISSACPTVVELIRKYYPQYSDYVTDMLSPVLAHTRLLRMKYGEDIGVVFVGPCIAKKAESDLHPEMMNVALTFTELRNWFAAEGIDPVHMLPEDQAFIPQKANEGALYPVDGGMIAGIKANCKVNEAEFMAFSGVENIQQVLRDLDKIKSDKPVFLELLACEGGCVNGPAVSTDTSTAVKRFDVFGYSKYSESDIPRKPTIDITNQWKIDPVKKPEHTEAEIRNALELVGKFTDDDELNCSGCGYDSCREFAKALLEGKAEPNMCVSYMRQLAHKKADALIRTMPSGVVIVDDQLKIVESNKRFAELLGEETVRVYETCPGLEGAYLEKIVPFSKLFVQVLNKGTDIVEKDIRLDDVVLHVTVFTIEPHRLVGGFLQDITAPAVQKEQIINRAKDVIAKNLATVQKIAYLLGENASDSEMILNSIVNSFSAESVETKKKDEK